MELKDCKELIDKLETFLDKKVDSVEHKYLICKELAYNYSEDIKLEIEGDLPEEDEDDDLDEIEEAVPEIEPVVKTVHKSDTEPKPRNNKGLEMKPDDEDELSLDD